MGSWQASLLFDVFLQALLLQLRKVLRLHPLREIQERSLSNLHLVQSLAHILECFCAHALVAVL